MKELLIDIRAQLVSINGELRSVADCLASLARRDGDHTDHTRSQRREYAEAVEEIAASTAGHLRVKRQ